MFFILFQSWATKQLFHQTRKERKLRKKVKNGRKTKMKIIKKIKQCWFCNQYSFSNWSFVRNLKTDLKFFQWLSWIQMFQTLQWIIKERQKYYIIQDNGIKCNIILFIIYKIIRAEFVFLFLSHWLSII